MSTIIWILIILAVLILLYIFSISFNIRAGMYVRAFCNADTKDKVIALTYDDGPDPEHTAAVLDVLKAHQVKATFFLIGEKAEAHPELVQRILDEGHDIGNHSWSHKNLFPFYSKKKMSDQLRKTDEAIEKITGRKPELFRPPFGVTNPTVAHVIKERGYKAIGWNIRSFDTTKQPRDLVFQRISQQVAPGAVVLMHDRMFEAEKLTEKLLDFVEKKGYRVIPISEMMKGGEA